jgi:hypothetical protein
MAQGSGAGVLPDGIIAKKKAPVRWQLGGFGRGREAGKVMHGGTARGPRAQGTKGGALDLPIRH